MTTGLSARAYALALVTLVACQRGDARDHRVASGGEVIGRSASLLDSARAFEARGDTEAAVVRYRRVLSVAPRTSDADTARARLEAIVAGGADPVRVVLGSVPAMPSVERGDPVVTEHAATPATPRRKPQPVRRPSMRIASRPLRHGPVRDVPIRQSASRQRVLRHGPVVANGEVVPQSVAQSAPETQSARSAASTKPKRKGIARAGHWIVARAAGLGAAGGVFVGALIGNVPGAIAMGAASGAAVGAKKAEQRVSPTVPTP